jgi:hypothetical protein
MLLGAKMKFYVLRLLVWLPNEVSEKRIKEWTDSS